MHFMTEALFEFVSVNSMTLYVSQSHEIIPRRHWSYDFVTRIQNSFLYTFKLCCYLLHVPQLLNTGALRKEGGRKEQ